VPAAAVIRRVQAFEEHVPHFPLWSSFSSAVRPCPPLEGTIFIRVHGTRQALFIQPHAMDMVAQGMGGSRLQADATPFNPRAGASASSPPPPATDSVAGVGSGSNPSSMISGHGSLALPHQWGGLSQPVGSTGGFVEFTTPSMRHTQQSHHVYHQYASPVMGGGRRSGVGGSRKQAQSSRTAAARKGEQEAVTVSGQRVFVLPKAVNAKRSSLLQVM